MRRTLPSFASLALLAILLAPLGAEPPAPAAPPALAAPALPSRLSLVERCDFSRYLDGRYLGHAYRETRLSLELDSAAALRGQYFAFEETLRDLRSEARLVDRSGRAEFRLGPLGALEGGLELDTPAYRGIPAAPAEGLSPGRVWLGEGRYQVELQGELLSLPVLVEYRAVGAVAYAGSRAFLVRAKFAVRLKGGRGAVATAAGSHELELYLDEGGAALRFIRDRFDETFGFSAGGTERRSGFRLLFFSGIGGEELAARGLALARALDSPAAGSRPGTGPSSGPAGSPTGGAGTSGTGGGAPGGGPAETDASPGSRPLPDSANLSASGTPSPGSGSGGTRKPEGQGESLLGAGPGSVEGPAGLPELAEGSAVAVGPPEARLELEAGEGGLILRILDLRFQPDSAELLPGELARLDLVAQALRASGGKAFLVEGHSASVGRPQGELELSARRARVVVDELVRRGLPASAFVYRGLGSSRPLAPNTEEAGRARNRRVEITILE